MVDDFGVKYVGEEHALHLKKALEADCTVTTEWEGKRYIGITLDWDYKRLQVHLSMPNYVKKALKQFKHELKRKQDAPYLPCSPHQIWRQETIRNTTINCAATRQERQTFHTTSMR